MTVMSACFSDHPYENHDQLLGPFYVFVLNGFGINYSPSGVYTQFSLKITKKSHIQPG
jgi:hypothetical protein